jgi:hypothetical protein
MEKLDPEMRPNWWGSETDPDPRCFFGTEPGQVWTLPEWQYLRRESIYPCGVRLPDVTIVEPEDLWTMDMIYAQLEKDLFAGPMLVNHKIQRPLRYSRQIAHLHPYAFPQYGQGIYAIYDKQDQDQEEELFYIGMSKKGVIGRAPAHFLSTSTYRAVRMKPFRRDEVEYLEKRLIRKYKPWWQPPRAHGRPRQSQR